MEFTLLWAVLTALALAWLGLRLWPDRLPDHALDHLIGAAVIGLIVGRLTAMIVQGVNPITHPADIIIIRGGVDTAAATLGFGVALVRNSRSTRFALDALAPATLLGLAGWHLGCLWRGACLGTPTDLAWGWALDGSAVTRHPVEIYAAVGLALAAWLVSRLGWQLWLRAGTGLALASAIRLISQPLRPSITGGPTVWYVTGIVVGLGAIVAGRALDHAKADAPT
jgi:prolipoprotein diacylglyceryltransferase